MKYTFFNIFILYLILCIGTIVKALSGELVRPLRHNELPPIVCMSLYDPNIVTNTNLLCSGVLITQSLVLTSAHCFELLNNSTMIEVIIDNDSRHRSVTYYTIWWITYLNWIAANNLQSFDGWHDIAVLQILGIVSHIVPAQITRISPIDIHFGRFVKICGCGRLHYDETPTELKTAFVKLMTREECTDKIQVNFDNRVLIPNGLVCSDNNPQVLLEGGDSGGPIFYFNNLIGINIGTYPNLAAARNLVQVNSHLDISLYRNFINTHMSIN